MTPVKNCARCLQTKPWTDYWAAARWPDGTMQRPQAHCKTCIKAKRRADRAANPAKYRARDQRDRAKMKADPIRLAKRRETQRQNSAAYRAKLRERTTPPAHSQ